MSSWKRTGSEVEHGQAGKDHGDLGIDALDQVHGFLLRSSVFPAGITSE
jgi:hypothetical protein